MLAERLGDCFGRDRGRLLHGITVDAGRNGRKGDRAKTMRLSDAEAALVAGGEFNRLPARPAAPDRPDGVDDEAGGKGVARSEEHTSELQSLLPTSYAVSLLK